MNTFADIRPDWIALDWGTSNLRAFAMTRGGAVLAQAQSSKGMSALSPSEFEPNLRDLLSAWSLPERCTVIACGMLGSRQGWQEAPYRAVPCPAPSSAMIRVKSCGPDLEVWLIPGIKQSAPADVMRGEETQIAGFLALNDDWDGVICLPGTHSKWTHLSANEIVSFRTFLTGELFDVISTQTVLRHSLLGDDLDEAAFDEAVSETLSRPEKFSSSLFSLRAADLLNGQNASIARARLSGGLIGLELASAKAYWLGQNVALIGSNGLSALYDRALLQQGIRAQCCDVDAVTQAGLFAAYQTL